MLTDASRPSEPRPEAALVTALELAGLDLWGTQLVVLSACDTGRGDVKLGQGVYGLRRSLAVAGAETVVMSLWKPPSSPRGATRPCAHWRPSPSPHRENRAGASS